MENDENKNNNNKLKEKNLENLISSQSQIKRTNIIDAEEISFNNDLKNLIYDEYGFTKKNVINKNKDVL
jgi:hypothetical protein